MEVAIAGVYSHSKDGEEYITRNGNPYIKVLFVQNDMPQGKTIYESFFLTKAAHYRVEMLFNALGKECPSADDIGMGDFRALISSKLDIEIGKNKGGYDTVVKFNSIAPVIVEPIESVLTDEISGQFNDDPDLDEDVPF